MDTSSINLLLKKSLHALNQSYCIVDSLCPMIFFDKAWYAGSEVVFPTAFFMSSVGFFKRTGCSLPYKKTNIVASGRFKTRPSQTGSCFLVAFSASPAGVFG